MIKDAYFTDSKTFLKLEHLFITLNNLCYFMISGILQFLSQVAAITQLYKKPFFFLTLSDKLKESQKESTLD